MKQFQHRNFQKRNQVTFESESRITRIYNTAQQPNSFPLQQLKQIHLKILHYIDQKLIQMPLNRHTQFRLISTYGSCSRRYQGVSALIRFAARILIRKQPTMRQSYFFERLCSFVYLYKIQNLKIQSAFKYYMKGLRAE